MLPIYWEKEDIRRIALTFGIILLCVAAIAVAVWGKRGFPVTTHKIDYQMYGVYVETDGTVGSSVDFSIKGRAFANIEKYRFLELEFQMPTSFPYSLRGSTCHPWGYENSFSDIGAGYFSYWVTTGYAYNKYTNDTVIKYFALCPEREYFIFHTNDDPTRYLVASTDPNTTPQEILGYFQDYIDTFINNTN